MPDLDHLLSRLEVLLADVEGFPPAARQVVMELLDGIDALHRRALCRLPDVLTRDELVRLRVEPALAWLLDAYGIGIDERALAEQALDEVRPFIHSHGGVLELLDVRDGVVNVRMAGACSGCSASAVTLAHGVERALRDNLPGFASLQVQDDGGAPHAPPGPTLLDIHRSSQDAVLPPTAFNPSARQPGSRPTSE